MPRSARPASATGERSELREIGSICALLLVLVVALAAPGAVAAAQAPLDAPVVAASDERAAEPADPAAPDASAGSSALDDPEVAAAIALEQAQDQAIERAVRARLARVEALARVEVEVAAGLATLRGTVDDESRRQIAQQLVEAVDGVVAVDNRLYMETALDRRLAPVLQDGLERLQRLVAALPLLALALLLVLALNWLGRLVAGWHWPYRRIRRNPFLADLLRQVVRVGFTLVGVLVALNLLGAAALVGAVLGAAGIVGLALGFAFKDLVENYIAGILLSLRQPFAPNDHIRIDGHEGKVAALTSRATTLITLDGNHLRLPNALVFKGVILNFSRNPTRMLAFDVGVGTSEDLHQAQLIAAGALAATPGVLTQPPPAALVTALADSSVTLRCSAWLDQRQADFGKVQSEAIQAVKVALEAAGLDLPEPIQRVQLLRSAPSAAPAAPASAAAAASPPASPRSSSLPPGAAVAAPVPDIAVDTSLQEQVDDEVRSQAEQNLLRSDAPRE
jgi:small conductance mechanosensitive channel